MATDRPGAARRWTAPPARARARSTFVRPADPRSADRRACDSPAAILHEPPGRTGRPRPFRKPVWFFECAAPTDSLQATRDWTRDEARDEWIDVLEKGRRILHQKRDRLLLLHGLASDFI